jgi:hypothetical protein
LIKMPQNKHNFIMDVRRYILRQNPVDGETVLVQAVAESEPDFPTLIEEYGRQVLPGHAYNGVRFMAPVDYRRAVKNAGRAIIRDSFEVGNRFGIYFDNWLRELHWGGGGGK